MQNCYTACKTAVAVDVASSAKL